MRNLLSFLIVSPCVLSLAVGRLTPKSTSRLSQRQIPGSQFVNQSAIPQQCGTTCNDYVNDLTACNGKDLSCICTDAVGSAMGPCFFCVVSSHNTIQETEAAKLALGLWTDSCHAAGHSVSPPSFSNTNTSTSSVAPGASTSNAIPSISTSNSIPSISASNAIPSISASNVNPSASTSSVTPSVGVASIVLSAGVSSVTPSVSTSSVTPSASTSSVTASVNTTVSASTLSSSISTSASQTSSTSQASTTQSSSSSSAQSSNAPAHGNGATSLPVGLFGVTSSTIGVLYLLLS